MSLSPFVTLVFVLLALSAPDRAVPQEVEDRTAPDAQELFATIMSPFCPGRTLAHCPSAQAAALRDSIRGWLAAGISGDSIRARLLAEYGDVVRGAPEARGVGLLAWIVPGVLLLAGATVLAARLRRASSAAPPPRPAGEPLSADERARLDRELAGL